MKLTIRIFGLLPGLLTKYLWFNIFLSVVMGRGAEGRGYWAGQNRDGVLNIYRIYIYIYMYSCIRITKQFKQFNIFSLSFLAKDSIYKALNVCFFVGFFFLLGLSYVSLYNTPSICICIYIYVYIFISLVFRSCK